MKKLFTRDKARIYGQLLFLCLVGFETVIALIIIMGIFSWPVDIMPISSFPRLLFFASIIFGVLAAMCLWRINIFTLTALAVMVVLSVMAFNSLSQTSSSIIHGMDRTLTIKSTWERNYNAGLGVVVIQSICMSNGTLIGVYNRTRIYEQDGTQKRLVNPDMLQPGQVVDITYTFLKDGEFSELLNHKVPNLGVRIWEGAAEIVIHKGEYVSVSPNVGFDLCESLFK